MIYFSERLLIAKRFEIWARENNVQLSTTGVICFLAIHGLLNEEAIYDYLTKNQIKENEK